MHFIRCTGICVAYNVSCIWDFWTHEQCTIAHVLHQGSSLTNTAFLVTQCHWCQREEKSFAFNNLLAVTNLLHSLPNKWYSRRKNWGVEEWKAFTLLQVPSSSFLVAFFKNVYHYHYHQGHYCHHCQQNPHHHPRSSDKNQWRYLRVCWWCQEPISLPAWSEKEIRSNVAFKGSSFLRRIASSYIVKSCMPYLAWWVPNSTDTWFPCICWHSKKAGRAIG